MPNPIDQTPATYTFDDGCSNCGAKRPRVHYSEYARYELVPPIAREDGEASGEPFVALVARADDREELDAVEDGISCDACFSLFTNIEITDWRASRERRSLDGLAALYRDTELGDPESFAYSAADQCAVLYELLNSLGYPVP